MSLVAYVNPTRPCRSVVAPKHECKRLKLRCDRQVPCSSCIRRRCGNVCPDGTLARGRITLSKVLVTEGRDLHDKIDSMRRRIAELESAIALLRPETSPPAASEDQQPNSSNIDSEELSGLFGTLSMGNVPDFVGPNAAADQLLYRRNTKELLRVGNGFMLDIMLRHCTIDLLTDISGSPPSVLEELPLQDEAYALVEQYFNELSWMIGAVSHDEVCAMLDTLYRNDDGQRPTSMNGLDMHDLAVLFAVFCVAAITKPDANKFSEDFRRNLTMICTCLIIGNCLERVTMQAIRALHIGSWALHLGDDPFMTTVSYNLVGIKAKMCKTLGLHTNDDGWPLSDKEKQDRRSFVLDIVKLDASISASCGRPTSWPLVHFDVRLPVDMDAYVEGGQWQQSFNAWSRSFVSTCLLRICDRGFCTDPDSYADILQMDRIVREHPIAQTLRTINIGQVETNISMRLVLQRAVTIFLPQKVLLYMHRSFFARAMFESPNDPLSSRFQPSVLAAFRASLYITATIRALYEQAPLCVRFPYMWSGAFSSSAVLGSIVIKSPKCALAQCAWVEFLRMMELFERVGSQSPTVTRVLPNMRVLHQKAKASWEASDAKLDDHEHAFIYGATHVMDSYDADGDYGPTRNIYLEELETDTATSSPGETGECRAAHEATYRLDDEAVWESFMESFGIKIPALQTTTHHTRSRWPESRVRYKRQHRRACIANCTIMEGLRIDEGDYTVQDFKFQSGQVLATLTLHYTTLGTLEQSTEADGTVKSNAVLILHGTGGSGSGFLSPEFGGVLFTPGGLLDASKHFIILPDGVGHGKSSKPSDGLRAKFPQYTYDDMVQLQYLLLTQHLHVRHLRLVMGTSMGGMHTWVWGYSFPDFADALMPLASLPVMIAGLNRMRRKIVLDALTREPGYDGGEYTAQPPGLAEALGILREMTAAPRALQRECPTRAAADAHLAAYVERGLAAQDANDMIFAYASSREYDPAPHLTRIAAPLLAVNSADDVVNPPDLGVMEAHIARVPRGRYVLIPTSDDTRGHGTHSVAKIWEHELRRLLEETK